MSELVLTKISTDDLDVICNASRILETPGVAIRISQLVGMPIEKALSALPGHWSTIVTRTTKTALEKAMDGALYTLNKQSPRSPLIKTHKLLAGMSGAVGGAFGVVSLAVELPISATLMLRSIADIARSEGESLDDLETRAACLEVFALGGDKPAGETADTGYYAIRSLMTKTLGDSAQYVVAQGVSKQSTPGLIRLVNAVASRFSVPVSQKLAAQAIPAVGAVGGATVNLIFMDHYQSMARAHFTVRRLEKVYGKELVQTAYQNAVKSQQPIA